MAGSVEEAQSDRARLPQIVTAPGEDEIWPDPMPSCTRVPQRSIQSCSLWLPRRSGAW